MDGSRVGVNRLNSGKSSPISCIHEIGLDVPSFGEQPALAVHA
jgi:hypothetical protein